MRTAWRRVWGVSSGSYNEASSISRMGRILVDGIWILVDNTRGGGSRVGKSRRQVLLREWRILIASSWRVANGEGMWSRVWPAYLGTGCRNQRERALQTSLPFSVLCCLSLAALPGVFFLLTILFPFLSSACFLGSRILAFPLWVLWASTTDANCLALGHRKITLPRGICLVILSLLIRTRHRPLLAYRLIALGQMPSFCLMSYD